MTNNAKNQSQDISKIEEKSWYVKLAPVFATLIPEYRADIISCPEDYVDIIKHKKLALELHEAKNKLKEADLAKLDLLHNISHSINTPCSGLLALITVLYEIEEDYDRKEYLSILRKSSEYGSFRICCANSEVGEGNLSLKLLEAC